MEDNKLLKRIDELEKQVQLLLKREKLNMFGSSHDTVGSTTSDLVLKTRGKIKLLIGNKFIDLLKDGKINVDSNLIYKVSNKDSIGSKIGIYITDDGLVYFKPKSGDPILIIGEYGTTYVSFLEPQETTSDNKHTALVNVGFLYSDINNISEDSLKNGIIYVESDLKLYCVKNGELSEYTCKFPNPFTELFIISKNDTSQGALLIAGKGVENSIAFDLLFIYNSIDNKSVIDSKVPLSFRVNGTEFLNISNDKSEFKNIVVSNVFQSPNYSNNSGFKLYNINGKSILEVDLIIERDAKIQYFKYPEYWIMDNNTITYTDNENGNEVLLLHFAFENTYQIGDILKVYHTIEATEDEDEKYELVTLKVIELVDNKSVKVEYLDLDLKNLIAFKIYPGTPIRIKENNIDLVQYSKDLEETILMRFGNLDELKLNRNDSKGDTSIKGFGFQSILGVFKEILYSNDYILLEDDNSSRLASTEWIHKLLPVGSIIMFNGTTIPSNWHICDGTEGTPNLIDKFIKSGSTSGITGGNNLITLSINNLPPHNHPSAVSDDVKSKLVPAYDEFYENTFDLGGDKHYVVESGYENAGDKGLVGIKLEDLTGGITGNGDSFDIQPEYYTLIFIMKIK